MMELWWEKGKKNLKDAHLALLNQCIWMDSCTTLLRFDSEFCVMYSDKEYLHSKELIRDSMSLVEMELFLTRANQSKQNQNGAQTYTGKLPSFNPLECGIVCEATMLVIRHDMLMLKIPEFSLVHDSVHEARPWYLDCFHCQIKLNNDARGYVQREIEEEDDDNDDNDSCDDVQVHHQVCSNLKKPYNMSSARKAFEKMFANVELDPKHVLHLGHVWGTLRNRMEGMDIESVSRLGQWSVSRDSLSMSYANIPQANILSFCAGFKGVDAYHPFWALISPPVSFVSMVLPTFRDAKHRALERKNERSLFPQKSEGCN